MADFTVDQTVIAVLKELYEAALKAKLLSYQLAAATARACAAA